MKFHLSLNSEDGKVVELRGVTILTKSYEQERGPIMSKIVLVGANHAGTAAANTILTNYPGHELTIIDRNDNISYLGC